MENGKHLYVFLQLKNKQICLLPFYVCEHTHKHILHLSAEMKMEVSFNALDLKVTLK